METTYLICAAVGGTLIVCQFVMTVFGMGGHHDLAGHDHVEVAGHGGGGDHHGDHGDDSTWFLGMLTFRTISAGLAFFGLVGVMGQRAELEPAVALVLALAGGLAALLLVGWTMKLLARLNIDGTVRIEKALGCRGTVYVPIPAASVGQGKVQVCVHNCTKEYNAIAKNALPTGAKIVVVAVVAADTVEVAPAQDR
jgi:hypothetical protein